MRLIACLILCAASLSACASAKTTEGAEAKRPSSASRKAGFGAAGVFVR